MEQNLLKIRCVHCGAKLTIRNQVNIEKLSVECPNCHEKFKVSEGMQSMSANQSKTSDEDTIYRQSKGSDTEDTIFNSGQRNPGRLVEIATGRTYPLKPGRNTIGRTSESTPTDISVDDPSRRMSRQHAIIEVRTMADGTFRHFLYNWKNKNSTCVDGHQLMQNDNIVLRDGQMIKFGPVTMRFSTPDDETTY